MNLVKMVDYIYVQNVSMWRTMIEIMENGFSHTVRFAERKWKIKIIGEVAE
jgi:hypothetical protein